MHSNQGQQPVQQPVSVLGTAASYLPKVLSFVYVSIKKDGLQAASEKKCADLTFKALCMPLT